MSSRAHREERMGYRAERAFWANVVRASVHPVRSRRVTALVFAPLAMILAACSATAFHSTWKAPDAQPVSATGEKVVALVVNANEASRRAAEDALARELSKRGALGIPAYTILGGVDVKDEGKIK